jgi:hypothetical protein
MKKKIITSCVLISAFIFSARATVHVVNNSPNNPGQFAQIDAAIAAANPGDTIYVQGSAAAYSAATVTKSITLLGPGSFNQTDLQLIANVNSIAVNGGISNVTIRGFYTSQISANYSNQLSNLTISHCYVTSQIGLGSMNNANNIFVYNNVFNSTGTNIELGATTVANGNANFIIQNNIFHGSISSLVVTNTIIQNNIFLSVFTAFNSICSNAIINNNIFASTDAVTNTVACVFNNNITYSPTVTYPLLGGTNLDNTNPLFVNVPDFNGYNNAYNYHLQTTSPGHNAGNDGTDIGIYGGQGYSVTTTGEVYNMPVIRKMDVQNTNVPQSGNVNVKVRSTKSRTN